MQASVHRYDEASGKAQVVTDAGEVLTVSATVVRSSGFHRLRIGQRLSLGLDESASVVRISVPGIEPRQSPAGTTPDTA
ncbi:hypothetical protein SAMN05421595_1732 [Austwickia chelonae]|uniref:Cold shock protein n=1 Tax=Austwickia chelonae NBRC 105200 TaxID=1184607 RepID=K6UKQ2_9MICO|nr:hypothetical protein [Austwickia chelonae]GAB76601.1 hypothetical protein AUCHE_01_01630 [Austwickia chelonae NBRC 105200]SEW27758.1 hypothetical protein SAMN05421595_1732 [Austwickia chelonae]